MFFPSQVELELRAQVRLFRELTGHLPHHMDGHQHVHVLPGNAVAQEKKQKKQLTVIVHSSTDTWYT